MCRSYLITNTAKMTCVFFFAKYYLLLNIAHLNVIVFLKRYAYFLFDASDLLKKKLEQG